jgi:hypothetical protein
MVIKRSMNPGFAGIDNDLYYLDRTLMLFGDAKAFVGDIVRELAAPVDLGGPGPDPVGGEIANGVAEQALLLAQPVEGGRGAHRQDRTALRLGRRLAERYPDGGRATRHGARTPACMGAAMDPTLIFALEVAALVVLVAVVVVLVRGGKASRKSPYAASTEGSTLCPSCGMGNAWTDRTCISCGADLPG